MGSFKTPPPLAERQNVGFFLKSHLLAVNSFDSLPSDSLMGIILIFERNNFCRSPHDPSGAEIS